MESLFADRAVRVRAQPGIVTADDGIVVVDSKHQLRLHDLCLLTRHHELQLLNGCLELFMHRKNVPSSEALEGHICMLTQRTPLPAKIRALRYINNNYCQLTATNTDKMFQGLIRCMKLNYEGIQREAVQAINKFACYPHYICNRIVQSGGLVALAECAQLAGGRTRDIAIQAIGNIAADCSTCRKDILSSPAAAVLIDIVGEHLFMKQYSVQNLLRTLAVVLENGISALGTTLTTKLLHCLYPLLYTSHDVIRKLAAGCVSHVAYGRFNEVQIDLILGVDGLIQRLIQLIDDPAASASVLLTIGRIVAGSDQQTEQVLAAGILPHLINLYSRAELDNARCRDVGWILSNLAAGNEQQLEYIFSNEHTVPIILDLSKSDERSVRVEACWAATNAFHRANPRRVVWLSGVIVPAIKSALDMEMGSALRENALRAVGTIVSRNPNFIFMLCKTHVMRKIRLLFAKEAAGTSMREIAGSLVASEDLMFSRVFIPSKFQFF